MNRVALCRVRLAAHDVELAADRAYWLDGVGSSTITRDYHLTAMREKMQELQSVMAEFEASCGGDNVTALKREPTQ